MVIEAIFEEMNVKQANTSQSSKKGVLILNTSYLDINELALVTSRPKDVIGLHFSPANIMRLLEIVAPTRSLMM